MIDKAYVQKLIENEIGSDFELYECHDTEPYVIITYKHKKYDIDDERGQHIGTGPIIYDKEKNEYKVLGSGEWFYGDYADYLNTETIPRDWEIINNCLNEKAVSSEEKEWLIDKIKKGINRRNRINTEDIDWLCLLLGARNTQIRFEMKFHDDLDKKNHCLTIFDNKQIQNHLVEIWKELGYPYEIISKTKLVLWKTKTSC